MLTLLIIFGARYLLLLPVVVLFVYFLLLSYKKQWNFTLLAVLSLPFAYGLGIFLGYFYYNPRPFVVDHIAPLVGSVPDNGFPSDHTLFTATLATIAFYFNRQLGIALWIVALLVGISRVAAGVHHTIDIIAGACVGLLAVWLVDRFLRAVRWYHL